MSRNFFLSLDSQGILAQLSMSLTIIRVLKEPDSIIYIGEEKVYFYKYYKNRKSKSKYLKIIVKYLNGSGYVITAYFARNIRKK